MLGNTILTPVTLWRDFDESLPFDEEILSEGKEGATVVRRIRISGRATEKGRVRIYMELYAPDKDEYPAVMVLFEAGHLFDREFIGRYVQQGYGVLCVDYCGDLGDGSPHTVYPEDIDYANYLRAGDHLYYAEPSARETSWFEWAAVARYAARYLSEHPEIPKFGGIGLRTGGEILFKIAPYEPLSCMISVCAAGWLAYRDMERFGEGETHSFNAERHRFIAGIDSQSYAPYIKCPVLLLSAINDSKYNYERVYDTFRQINPEVEKAILYSAHGNGLIGSHSLYDIDLFLGKYLMGRSVFISRPIDVEIAEDGEGRLVAKGKFDDRGEIEDFGVFFTEKVTGGGSRDWTRVLGKKDLLSGSVGTVPVSLYKSCKRALIYSFVKYSNNFSVTSKILEVSPSKDYSNSRPKTRVLYTNADGRNVFTGYRLREHSIADCFHSEKEAGVRLLPGYGGIMGLTSDVGMISYRVGEQGYEPPAGAAFGFDAWCAETGMLTVTFFRTADLGKGYSVTLRVEGGGKWKNFFFGAEDFKQEGGAALEDFSDMFAVLFEGKGEILINNVLWI